MSTQAYRDTLAALCPQCVNISLRQAQDLLLAGKLQRTEFDTFSVIYRHVMYMCKDGERIPGLREAAESTDLDTVRDILATQLKLSSAEPFKRAE